MVWDSVDDWDDPCSCANENDVAKRREEARASNSNTYICRYVDNNKYRYYYVGMYRYTLRSFHKDSCEIKQDKQQDDST